MNTIAGRIASDATYQAVKSVQRQERICDACHEPRYPGAFMKGSTTCQRCVKANQSVMPSCHPMLMSKW